MAKNEKQTIVIKKIKKGGHGHHGGAWKVAYADFVTAMMAFFMVMWLLGSDEETKAAIADYFNNPTSAWRKDLSDKDTMPLGEMTGAGESILKGAGGAVPEDLVKRPQSLIKPPGDGAGEALEQMLSDESLMTLDLLKFSIPEELLFKPKSAAAWSPQASKLLGKVGLLARRYQGKVAVQTSYGRDGGGTGAYEFEMSRAVSVARYLVDQHWADEERIKTSTVEERVDPDRDSSAGPARKVEFTFFRAK